MKRGKFYFIFGGARSGKSSFAEKLASSLGGRVTYIATAEALDEEMVARIKEHQKRRPATWKTIEEPYRVAELLEEIGQEEGVILVDCLTLLLTNLYYKEASEQESSICLNHVLSEIKRLAKAAKECRADVLIVSNEVGLGVVPDYPDGRIFRDLTGWANQIMTAEADKAYFLISGMPLDIKALRADPEV